MKLKFNKSIPVPFDQKFLKEVPMVDAKGKPIPNNPPLSKDGFWEKPKSTADILRKKYRKGLK